MDCKAYNDYHPFVAGLPFVRADAAPNGTVELTRGGV